MITTLTGKNALKGVQEMCNLEIYSYIYGLYIEQIIFDIWNIKIRAQMRAHKS